MTDTPTPTGTHSRLTRVVARLVGHRCPCPGCFPAVTLMRLRTMGMQR